MRRKLPLVIDVLRAYRVTLDPTPAQEYVLASHAGASRWAYNLALAAKLQAREIWLSRVAEHVEAGLSAEEARSQTKVLVPSRGALDKARVRVRGTDRLGAPCAPNWVAARDVLVADRIEPEVADAILLNWAGRCDPALGLQPWAPAVPNSVIQRGELDADTAWKNWMASLKGQRAGRRMGFPRFKSRGRSRDSFYLTNNECRIATYRRLRLGGVLGEVRTHNSLRRVHRAVTRRGAVIQSVTVSRGGHRWYASVLVKESVTLPGPTRRQRAAGAVGISAGVADQRLLLSTGEEIHNPFLGPAHEQRIARAQRALSRTRLGELDEAGHRHASKRRGKVRRQLARLHHQLACQRATHTHEVTRDLTRRFAEIVLEDLDILALTVSARGRRGQPGRAVKAKARANRATLDVEPGELRRQLTYKASWYGSTLTVADRQDRPDCGIHGRARAKLDPDDAVCTCGLVADRAIAQALAAKAVTPVASDVGETQNARGATGIGSSGAGVSRREGPRGSPSGGDARASP